MFTEDHTFSYLRPSFSYAGFPYNFHTDSPLVTFAIDLPRSRTLQGKTSSNRDHARAIDSQCIITRRHRDARNARLHVDGSSWSAEFERGGREVCEEQKEAGPCRLHRLPTFLSFSRRHERSPFLSARRVVALDVGLRVLCERSLTSWSV